MCIFWPIIYFIYLDKKPEMKITNKSDKSAFVACEIVIHSPIRYFFAAMSLLYMRFYAIKVRCCRIFNVYIQDRYETEQYINVPPFQVALVISVPCPCLGSCSDDLFRWFHHPYSITTYKRCSPDLRQMLKPSTIGTIYKRNLEERIRQELKAHKCLKLQKVNFPRFLFMTTMISWW